MTSSSRYVIYARKSSEDEDRQVLSIDSQIRELNELAARNGITVAAQLTESQSAKAPGRPVFSKLMAEVMQGKVKGILCWKLDRLARNPIDGGSVIWALKEKGVEIITPVQRYRHQDENSILMYLEFGMAQKYIDDLSKNVKRGLKAKVEMGWMPGWAPLGYKNTRSSQKGTNKLVKDEQRFLLVRKLWDLMLTGAYTLPQISEIARRDLHLKTRGTDRWPAHHPSKSTIFRMFTNPFYYGWFEYGGNLYPGKHEPMVTKREFEQVQMLLGRAGRPRPKKRRWFAYVGFIRCGGCGAMVTAEERVKRQKNGNVHTYIYYHCTKQKKPRCAEPLIEEKALEGELRKLIDAIDISQAFGDWILVKILDDMDGEAEQHASIDALRRKAYEECLKRLDGLIDMRAAREIEEDEFKSKRARLLQEKARLEDFADQTDMLRAMVEEILQTATNSRERFDAADMELRRQFAAALAGDSNLVLHQKNLRFSKQNRLLVLQKYLSGLLEVKPGFEPPETQAGRVTLADLFEQNVSLRAFLNDVRTSREDYDAI